MATTTNFGWETPDDTDLVKDGAAAIRTALGGVDTSFVDLKGGTTGQVLAKASNTDLDFVWSADAAGMTNPMTTTGDTIYSSSGSTPARLGIGTSGQVLTVSGGVPTWAAPSGASDNFQLINAGGTALTGSTTVTVSGISGKNKLWIWIDSASSANVSAYIRLRLNSDSGTNYDLIAYSQTASSAGVQINTFSQSEIDLGQMGNNAANYVNALISIEGTNAIGYKPFDAISYANGGTTNTNKIIKGQYKGTSAITSVSVISSSGSLDNGTIYIYGA